ncbi:hypothetical protein [Paraburkholderia aspalathi]|uniref:hypothetical protein n=1 Tax=Paraburkholderia aspalathi TaxID=1324617 RepID=UPI0038B7E7CE
MLDVTGVPHVLGHVRTPGIQALAAWASHRAGTLLNKPEQIVESRSYLATLITTVMVNDWPVLLDRSAAVVVDGASSLSEVSILILAAHEMADSEAFWLNFFKKSSSANGAFHFL